MTAEGSQLTPLEIASGLVLGLEPESTARRDSTAVSPRVALERALLPALRRPPCLVSFSGGRDSSAVLAVAAAVARREGLPPPVPATNRFHRAADATESEWQERVVSHLGLDDWARIDHGDELDCVGPIATHVLRRHGVLWPFNAHFHLPLLRLASGGSLLTGIAGDELLSVSSGTLRAALRQLARGRARAALRGAFAAAPPLVRRAVNRRRFELPFRWLQPAARARLVAIAADHAAAEPFRWRPHVRWVTRLRYLAVGLASLDALARDERVLLAHPFVDAGFAGALESLPRRARFRNRTGAMRALFGDVLPDDVLTRSSKAVFDEAFWRGPSRSFAAAWDGSGIDSELVDAGALKAEWESERPDPRSFTLAQAVWLSTQRRQPTVSSIS